MKFLIRETVLRPGPWFSPRRLPSCDVVTLLIDPSASETREGGSVFFPYSLWYKHIIWKFDVPNNGNTIKNDWSKLTSTYSYNSMIPVIVQTGQGVPHKVPSMEFLYRSKTAIILWKTSSKKTNTNSNLQTRAKFRENRLKRQTGVADTTILYGNSKFKRAITLPKMI